MFERFTERARQVIVLAQEEARRNKQAYIGPEHILLGLLREEEGLAARALGSLDVTIEKAREAVEARTHGRLRDEDELDELTGQIPLTPRARKGLELSLREALSLGHNYIGTEHVLLGLLRDDSVAVEILRDDFHISNDTIRNEVIRMLSGPKAPQISSDATSRSPSSTPSIQSTPPIQFKTHPVAAEDPDRLANLLVLTAKLARLFPDVPEERIAKAAKIIHV